MDCSGYPNNRFLILKPSSSEVYLKQDNEQERRRRLCFEVKRLKRLLDYEGYYIAFLLGCLSEEEFKEISERFCVA